MKARLSNSCRRVSDRLTAIHQPHDHWGLSVSCSPCVCSSKVFLSCSGCSDWFSINGRLAASNPSTSTSLLASSQALYRYLPDPMSNSITKNCLTASQKELHNCMNEWKEPKETRLRLHETSARDDERIPGFKTSPETKGGSISRVGLDAEKGFLSTGPRSPRSGQVVQQPFAYALVAINTASTHRAGLLRFHVVAELSGQETKACRTFPSLERQIAGNNGGGKDKNHSHWAHHCASFGEQKRLAVYMVYA